LRTDCFCARGQIAIEEVNVFIACDPFHLPPASPTRPHNSKKGVRRVSVEPPSQQKSHAPRGAWPI
jgi:hypothetical protein